MSWWQRWRARLQGLQRLTEARAPLDDATWQRVVQPMAFLQRLSADELARLQRLSAGFLARKEFHGLMDLQVSDDMAIAVAAQACLPLLHLAPPDRPELALNWYDSFVSIILAPSEVPREHTWMDEAGVMHHSQSSVSGEVSEDGPVLLSWPDVLAGMGQAPAAWLQQREAALQERGALPWHPDTPYNVVIHEFCHKLDMLTGEVDACPPLPAGSLGQRSAAQARREWLRRLNAAFEDHVEQVEAAERFGQPPPWLDAYGASDVTEFFPVACEAYFTQRERFAQELPDVLTLFDAFFRPNALKQQPR